VLGKLRLAHAPRVNHWWHVALYVCARGLTTSPMPWGKHALTLPLDFCDHRLLAERSDGRSQSFALQSMTVAEFYRRTMSMLEALGLEARISETPVDVVDRTPFSEDRHHASYDRLAVERLHRILSAVDRVFTVYRGGFDGKSNPVHFFWGAFDLAVTRFSGRPNPAPPAGAVMAVAYSHVVISHGFWPGGDWPIGGRVGEPVFYAFAVPEPPGFREASVRPPAARYAPELGEFLLPYEAVRQAADPGAVLVDFMNDTYLAAAEGMGWEIQALRHPHAAAG
jgi:hypothetical protein